MGTVAGGSAASLDNPGVDYNSYRYRGKLFSFWENGNKCEVHYPSLESILSDGSTFALIANTVWFLISF